MGGSVLEKKSSFKMLGLYFSFKLDRRFYIISIAKTAPKKIGTLICSKMFLSPEAALCLLYLQCGLACNIDHAFMIIQGTDFDVA